MSRFNKLLDSEPAATKSPFDEDEPPISAPVPSLPDNLEGGKDLDHHLNRIKKFCVLMIITSPIMPIVSWFIDPYHFVFYQSLLIFLLQIYVAWAGFRCTKDDHYNRLDYYRKLIHSFYIFYLIALILNQVAAVIIMSAHNFKNCDQFVNNRVCVNRTGLMTTQLVVALFSPGLDFSVLIFYMYMLSVLNDCKAELVRRRL